MVINLGAYATEIVRAGIESFPHGQTEAGRALGLRPIHMFRLIILPPTLRAIYQPLAAQFTLVLLGSSITSAISANELTSAANLLQSINLRTFETYVVVTFMYLIMVFAFRGLLAIGYTLERDDRRRNRRRSESRDQTKSWSGMASPIRSHPALAVRRGSP